MWYRSLAEALWGHLDQVAARRAGTAQGLGLLAGRAIGNARRLAGRNLTDAERRQVWAALWETLQALNRVM